MLDIALISQDDLLAHRLRHAFDSTFVRIDRYEILSNDTVQWCSRKFDLMLVHSAHAVMDFASPWLSDHRWTKPAATIALLPERDMVFAPALLDAGFDRCLAETVEPVSLCAEVRALTRRSQGMAVSVSHYGPLSFNHATQHASVAGVPVDLTVREAQVLDILLKRVGQIVSKDIFIQEIAPENPELNSNATEVYVHRLRKKISHDILPVRNIKRCGYYLPRYVQS